MNVFVFRLRECDDKQVQVVVTQIRLNDDDDVMMYVLTTIDDLAEKVFAS